MYDPDYAGGCIACPTGSRVIPSPTAAAVAASAGSRQLNHGSQNSYCHPAGSKLAQCDGTPLRIDAAAVGDLIRTPSGCEPITGLFHADAEAVATYHKFTTKGGATVAISDDHWLFVNGAEAAPRPSSPVIYSRPSKREHDPVVRVETTTERGAYHILVASGAYYVDGVAASTYVAHVPLGVWKVFADGYASLRYKMGAPIARGSEPRLGHVAARNVRDAGRPVRDRSLALASYDDAGDLYRTREHGARLRRPSGALVLGALVAAKATAMRKAMPLQY